MLDEDAPERPVSRKPRVGRWIALAALALLAAFAAFVMVPTGPPDYAFLKGAVLYKVDSGADPTSGFGGTSWVYRLRGEYAETVRQVDRELADRGEGWSPAQSELATEFTLGIDNERAPTSTSRFQLFHNPTMGVEVVEPEPTIWSFGDRQTLWQPPGTPDDPNVLTIFITKPSALGSVEGLQFKVRRWLGLP